MLTSSLRRNHLLQVLFHNAAFRDALYRTPTAQRSDAEETVVSALQKIFADLEIGERSSCDVNILTDLLGLEVSVQQDPQEFGKLFMAKVEECVGGFDLIWNNGPVKQEKQSCYTTKLGCFDDRVRQLKKLHKTHAKRLAAQQQGGH